MTQRECHFDELIYCLEVTHTLSSLNFLTTCEAFGSPRYLDILIIFFLIYNVINKKASEIKDIRYFMHF